MSETNMANSVAFHKQAVFEGDVENAFRRHIYARLSSTSTQLRLR